MAVQHRSEVVLTLTSFDMVKADGFSVSEPVAASLSRVGEAISSDSVSYSFYSSEQYEMRLSRLNAVIVERSRNAQPAS
jgi:hypothetical protein